MNKFLLVFNDGSTEQRESITSEMLHFYEKGLVKFLFNITEGTQFTGTTWEKVTEVLINE